MEKEKVLHFPVQNAGIFSLFTDRVPSSRSGMEKKKMLPFPCSDTRGIISLR
jgi:hypothetical protein